MIAHTPGPWNSGSSDLACSQLSVHGKTCAKHTTLLRMVSQKHGMSFEEIMANARLISAAPDLLEALQHAIQWHDQITPGDVDRYRAVVFKATGGAA